MENLKPIKYVYTKWRSQFWEYECSCGKHFVCMKSKVNSGKVKDCGCSSRFNLEGKLFGRLTAKEYVKGGKWRCVCSCGNETVVDTSSLTRGCTKSCGCYRDEVKRRRRVKGDIPDRKEALYKQAFVQLKSRHTNTLKFSIEDLISFEDWKELVNKPCFYCGKPPSRELKDGLSDAKIHIGGVDRIDPSKGYIKGNVIPCCWDCNIAKSDLTVEQFVELITKWSTNLDRIKSLSRGIKKG